MKKRTFGSAVIGYVGFFLLVAGILTVTVLVYSSVSVRFADKKGLIAAIMLGAVVILAAVCTLVDFLRRKYTVTRPVEKILDATARIAEGDFSVRLSPAHTYNRFNEYDTIMDNLNKMAAQLSDNEILKTDFISNVSHELKTPLAIMQNYAELLKNAHLDTAERAQYAQTLIAASQRLTELVGNILKLNKLENQKITEKRETIRLDELLAQSVLGFEEKIEEKQLNLDCELAEVSVFSFPSYLEIVFNNLISNAVKFTENGGSVNVRLANQNGKAVVSISDTGCGISPETGAHIFDKFYQGDTSHAQEGNGLGLALVKKVIDTIGGEISVRSEVGNGSTFTVTLGEETE